MAFKKGDVVQLKSGGPLMAVEDVCDLTEWGGPRDGVNCQWFDEKDHTKVLEQAFDAAVLKIHEG